MNRAQTGPCLVLFDIDGTLVREPSTEKRFALWMLLKGRIGPLRLLAYAVFCLRYLPRYGSDVFAKNKSLMWRRTADSALGLARDWAARHLRGALQPACVERLEMHRKQGDTLVLLSGTPDFLAQAVADELDVPHVIATRCPRRKGRFCFAPPEVHRVGKAKREAAHTLCTQFGISPRNTIAYADSISDLPLLAACGHPVAVTPDRALAAEAQRHGWEMLGAKAPDCVRASA
ncbi:HAD family hydrolase [Candidatus Foliamicus sp.]